MTRNNYGTLEMSMNMAQTDAWIQDLMLNGRKRNTCATHRNNVRQCLRQLIIGGFSTDVNDIDSTSILYLWGTLRVKEEVRITYVRSLAQMVRFHTGKDILKEAKILRNREQFNRVFISTEDFCRAHRQADPFQRLILCLGAYMGLRRKEMAELRDCDIVGDMMTIHGKGHGDGLIVSVKIPQPVMNAIVEYRNSTYKMGIRADDYLIQTRSHGGILHMTTPARVGQEVCRLAKETGIHITTHSLRRFFATTLYYETDCDLQTVRSLMRHADLSTTMKCYVDAYQKNEREASDKLTEYISKMIETVNGVDEDLDSTA